MNDDDLRYRPYPYQLEALRQLVNGYKRAIWVWHRRSGKDLTALLGWVVPQAMRFTGAYYYFFPTYAQGKKILWDGYDNRGNQILDLIGPAMGMTVEQGRQYIKRNETELQITLPPVRGGSSGSIIQIVGVDKYDAVMGTNPIGCVFSEYSLQDPAAWLYIRPILEANHGWALFIFTPRGHNHAYDLYQAGLANRGVWSVFLRTIDDTRDHNGHPIITTEQIDQMRREGIPENIIQQEYYCSFDVVHSGSFYADLVERAREEGRIKPGLYDPNYPVETFWDLGVDDHTVIVFRQVVGHERRFIDVYANRGKGLDHYAAYVRQRGLEKSYRYACHYFPWDMEVRDFSTGTSRLVAARRLGLTPARVVPKMSFDEGIDAVRRAFQFYWFDEVTCADLIRALQSYQRQVDQETGIPSNKPTKSIYNHYADAVRYEAIIGKSTILTPELAPPSAIGWEDPFTDYATSSQMGTQMGSQVHSERGLPRWETPIIP